MLGPLGHNYKLDTGNKPGLDMELEGGTHDDLSLLGDEPFPWSVIGGGDERLFIPHW